MIFQVLCCFWSITRFEHAFIGYTKVFLKRRSGENKAFSGKLDAMSKKKLLQRNQIKLLQVKQKKTAKSVNDGQKKFHWSGYYNKTVSDNFARKKLKNFSFHCSEKP